MAEKKTGPPPPRQANVPLTARTLPISPCSASSCFSTCTKIVQLLFLPVRTNIHKFAAAPYRFPKPRSKSVKETYTSREYWMERCTRKLQDGSKKSAAQKIIPSIVILPLRYSRGRRDHPSLRSRHPQNRFRRRMPPPSRPRTPFSRMALRHVPHSLSFNHFSVAIRILPIAFH